MKSRIEVENCLVGVEKVQNGENIGKYGKGFLDALKWVLGIKEVTIEQ